MKQNYQTEPRQSDGKRRGEDGLGKDLGSCESQSSGKELTEMQKRLMNATNLEKVAMRKKATEDLKQELTFKAPLPDSRPLRIFNAEELQEDNAAFGGLELECQLD